MTQSVNCTHTATAQPAASALVTNCEALRGGERDCSRLTSQRARSLVLSVLATVRDARRGEAAPEVAYSPPHTRNASDAIELGNRRLKGHCTIRCLHNTWY